MKVMMRRLSALLGGLFASLLLSVTAYAAPMNGKIAYSEMLNGTSQIFTMVANGTNRQQISSGDSTYYSPAWSPDGTHLAYTSNALGGGVAVFTMKADGADQMPVSPAGSATRPAWSPSGSQIAFAAIHNVQDLSQLYVENSDGSNLHLQPHTNRSNANYAPAWSPDGTKLLYISQPQPKNGVYPQEQIRSIDLASGTNTLLFRATTISHVAWSPDGTTIAFTGTTAKTASYTQDIYLLNADGTGLRQLTTADAATRYQDVTWSPDGTKLLYDMTQLVSGGYQSSLQTRLSSGGGVKTLVNPTSQAAFVPSWQTR